MPSILPSRYDDFLPAAEAFEKYQREKVEPQLDTYRLSDHEAFRDFERRKGEVLHSSRFIARLKRLEPRLVIQQQINFPDDWGLYFQMNGKLLFIAQVSKGWMTEFSWCVVDDRNLPDVPHWGWRTVLLRLLSRGILTWKQVSEEFGDPANANTDRWHIYTDPFRHSRALGMIHQGFVTTF